MGRCENEISQDRTIDSPHSRARRKFWSILLQIISFFVRIFRMNAAARISWFKRFLLVTWFCLYKKMNQIINRGKSKNEQIHTSEVIRMNQISVGDWGGTQNWRRRGREWRRRGGGARRHGGEGRRRRLEGEEREGEGDGCWKRGASRSSLELLSGSFNWSGRSLHREGPRVSHVCKPPPTYMFKRTALKTNSIRKKARNLSIPEIQTKNHRRYREEPLNWFEKHSFARQNKYITVNYDEAHLWVIERELQQKKGENQRVLGVLFILEGRQLCDPFREALARKGTRRVKNEISFCACFGEGRCNFRLPGLQQIDFT